MINIIVDFLHRKLAKLYYTHFYFFFFIARHLFSARPKKDRKVIFLYPHLGLGDLLVINGMVRHLAHQHPIYLVVQWRNRHDAAFLFRDLKGRINFYTVYSHNNLAPYDGKNLAPYDGKGRVQGYNQWKVATICRLLGADFYSMGANLRLSPFTNEKIRGQVAQQLYKTLCHDVRMTNTHGTRNSNHGHGLTPTLTPTMTKGLDPAIMHDGFIVKRDRRRELDFYNRVVATLGTRRYIVIHDDPARGFIINHDNIPELKKNPDLGILFIGKNRCPIKNNNIFETLTLLERAVAFHGFDSSFMWLIELGGLTLPSYLHAVPARPAARNRAMARGFRKNWILVA